MNLGPSQVPPRPRRSPRPVCPDPDSAIAVAVFVVIGSLTVVGPVLFYVVATAKAVGPLATIKEFMSTTTP